MDWFDPKHLKQMVEKYHHAILTFLIVFSLTIGVVVYNMTTITPTATSTAITCDEVANDAWREIENVEFYGFAVTATSGQAKKQGNPPQWVAFKGAAQQASLLITLDNAQCVRLVGINERTPNVWFYQNPTPAEFDPSVGELNRPQSDAAIAVPAGARSMSVSAPESGVTRITKIEVYP